MVVLHFGRTLAQDARERMCCDGFYTEVMRRWQAHLPGVVFVDARYSRYPDAAFVDNVHLNARGAAILSLDTATSTFSRGHRRRPEVSLTARACSVFLIL